MSAIIKYFIFIIIFISLILFSLVYTPFGNKLIYSAVGYTLSKKTDLKVEVQSINVHQYPYLVVDMVVEQKYNLELKGTFYNNHIDMDYRLTSNCLQNDICTIDDEIVVLGHINGPLGDIHVTGEGKALEGNVSYVLMKHDDTFKDVNFMLNDVNSSKLFTLLGQTAIFKGKANAHILFDHIGENSKTGKILYDVKDKDFSGLHIDLHAQIDIHDANQTFIIDVTAPELTVHLTKGQYDEERKYAHAFYALNIKDLSHLEHILGHKFIGPFYAFGEIEYDKHIIIKGLSKSFDGLLDFLYEKDVLQVNLKDIPFRNITQQLAYKAPLDANITGQIEYHFIDKRITAKTKLKNARFLPTELLDTLSQKSGINISQEVFDDSSLDLTYKDDILSGDIKFANTKNHLLLRDTTVNPAKKSINSYIDLQIQKHKIAGKTYIAMLDDATPMQNALQDTYIRFDGKVDTHYNLKLNGLVNDSWINMDYALNAARFPSHICIIEDNVDFMGHINGPFSHLHISGQGKALDGNVSYEGIKINDTLENFTFTMNNIHALKLSTLLGKPSFPKGRADMQANFKYLSKDNKKGTFTYILKKGTFSKLPFTLHTQINVDNAKKTFTAEMTLANAKINITKGSHDSDKNITSAFYVIDVKDLSKFEALFGFKYQGPFYAMGEATHNKHLKIQGLSKTFGGMLDFVYEKDKLHIELDAVSFKQFMMLFPYPLMLDAKTTGYINYDFIKKSMIVKTKLNKAKFLHTDLVSNIYKKANVNMLVEEFDDSSLEASYQNGILLGDLKLTNETSSFSLTHTELNSEKNTINAYFALKMQNQEFSGKVYGSLDDPEINLDMQKLIQHKMDQQLDSMMGKENREMMESMPMGGTAKDVATGTAAGFMKIFF
ncbi:MAG: hypothetical protein OQK45_05390 [Sulfurovum sp.]|nr:hypothetical protein [Sulfurovum sp.]